MSASHDPGPGQRAVAPAVPTPPDLLHWGRRPRTGWRRLWRRIRTSRAADEYALPTANLEWRVIILYTAAIFAITDVAWFDLRSEESWEASIFDKKIAYPVLQEIRQKLGYM